MCERPGLCPQPGVSISLSISINWRSRPSLDKSAIIMLEKLHTDTYIMLYYNIILSPLQGNTTFKDEDRLLVTAGVCWLVSISFG